MSTTISEIDPIVLRNKAVVLGNAAIGKTSLIQAFTEQGHQFSKSYNMTINSDLKVKTINIPDTKYTVELYLQDVGGNDMFAEYVPKFCKGATSFMLVFDTTQPESFKALGKWCEYLKHIKTLKNCKGILVAAKLDQSHRRLVSQTEAEDFARKNNLANNLNVEAPFYYLAYSYYERYTEFLKTTKKSCENL